MITLRKAIAVMKMEVILWTLPVLFWHFYRKNTSRMQKFYFLMLTSWRFRTAYALNFAMSSVLFNTIYMKVTGQLTDTLVSVIIAVLLSNYKVFHPLYRTLHGNRYCYCALFFASVAMMFNPHMYSLSFQAFLLMVAAAFYPSTEGLVLLSSNKECDKYRSKLGELVDIYY